MPRDEWLRANHRAVYGRARPAEPPKSRRRRPRSVKNKFVSIGVCAVKTATNRAVLVTIPDGRERWLPRNKIRNGNMKFTAGQILKLDVAKWLAVREQIPFEESR